ncbi:hypothetical protein GWI33_019017 [Rhynchophorus ferrugineus]|uniref:Uncharacterized protein n=1 Tax=Rhynchophorus ferrugineus TaxID=354439 RepID=A0A834M5N8_RHYFE|nr:hypothetical protein GWI33_019017 [Rhynchophorus ferrugineus]
MFYNIITFAATLTFANAGFLQAPAAVAYSSAASVTSSVTATSQIHPSVISAYRAAPIVARAVAAPGIASAASVASAPYLTKSAPFVTAYSTATYNPPTFLQNYAAPALAYSAPAVARAVASAPALAYSTASSLAYNAAPAFAYSTVPALAYSATPAFAYSTASAIAYSTTQNLGYSGPVIAKAIAAW